ncbi:MAG TPA: HPF/RaiA family ribosome-associated protein [Gemmatimonadales bacterium]|nr:HPF/RaiA family ribosome-associated protein [Gemmatimonadales bacterium]
MTMAAQLQITVRDMPHSAALESRIRRQMAGLERIHPRITSFNVTLEAPHHHKHSGNHFNVKLDIRFPAGEIVVNRDHAEDIYVALRDAFQAARRQIIEHAERGQRADKTHRLRVRGAAPEGGLDE